MKISCGFPPSKDIVRYARFAEQLGYERVWTFDSPALYGDIWVALARIAEHTTRIGLGTAVVVPSLRHPMVTASAIATIEELAPGRLMCAFGTGFTARMSMGQRGMRWVAMQVFLRQLRGLLRGDVVEIDGKACQMIHTEGFAPARPIQVPLLVAPAGPKGFAVARELSDGVMCEMTVERGFEHCVKLVFGTVLDSAEDHTSERVRQAVGPWFVPGYHMFWERNRDMLQQMPGGSEWLHRIEAERPERERHLVVHQGHVTHVSERDRPLLDAAGPLLLAAGWNGPAASYPARVQAAEAEGATEILYAPAGPDIPRELRAFAAATGLGPAQMQRV